MVLSGCCRWNVYSHLPSSLLIDSTSSPFSPSVSFSPISTLDSPSSLHSSPLWSTIYLVDLACLRCRISPQHCIHHAVRSLGRLPRCCWHPLYCRIVSFPEPLSDRPTSTLLLVLPHEFRCPIFSDFRSDSDTPFVLTSYPPNVNPISFASHPPCDEVTTINACSFWHLQAHRRREANTSRVLLPCSSCFICVWNFSSSLI